MVLETEVELVTYLDSLEPGTEVCVDVNRSLACHPMVEDHFFDYTVYATEIADRGVLEGVTRMFPEKGKYRKVDVGREVVCRKKDRNIIYVLCPNMEAAELAMEKYAKYTWARVVWIPTTFYLESVMYFHTLQSRQGEWEHADYVGTISHSADTKIQSLDLNRTIQPAKDIDAEVVCFMYRGDPLLGAAEKWHPGFTEIWSGALESMGYTKESCLSPSIPSFYANYWCATPPMMMQYMNFFKKFKFALETVESIQFRLWSDSGYLERGVEIARLTREKCMCIWGQPWYTFHAFICERVPCFFFHHIGAKLAGTY